MANNNTCTSITNLCRIKDVTPEIAKAIREVWKTDKQSVIDSYAGDLFSKHYNKSSFRQQKRMVIDRLIGSYGIEYLGIYKPSEEHVYYCNAGDTYATTTIFIGRRLIVASWGDLVENNQIREH